MSDMKRPSILSILCFVSMAGVILAVTLCNGPTRAPGLNPSLYTAIMESLHYAPAEVAKKPNTSDGLKPLEDVIEQTIIAEGTWTPPDTIFLTDTVQVKVHAVELDDGSKWVRMEIAGKPVAFSRVEWFEKQTRTGRWSAGMEWSILHGGDAGLYGCYRLFNAWKVRVGVAAVVDYSPEDMLSPQWGAVELRLDYPITQSFEIGGGIGAHLTADDLDWHVSVGAGFRF